MINRQSFKQYKGRSKPRPPKLPKQRRSNKVEINGLSFDSETEFRYYLDLKRNPGVRDIELQPRFEIIPEYDVTCKRCNGTGSIQNAETGRPNKCRRCKLGSVTKSATHYTADFKVIYIDGFEEVVDVKGGPVERDFPLRKKLFERLQGIELIVVRWDQKTLSWKRE